MRRALIAYKRHSDYCQKDGTGLVAARVKATIESISLAMRLTAAILIIGALQVNARGVAQKVSISGTNLPLTAVFHAIEDQTGYGVLMEKSTLEAAKPVTISLANGTIDDVMKVCFSFQPWKLHYVISGKTIAISKEVSEVPKTIAGKVKTETGAPLSGATVTLKGTKKGGITNKNGEFLLQNVAPGKYTLEISFVGYDAYKEDIIVTGETTNITAILKQAINNLDEAQVIAYGEVSKRFQIGDVTTVKADDVEKQPVSNPLLALEGRVPGLFVTQSTGLSGSGVTVRIQGQNSIQNGNDPLYVIDGVPYTSQLLPNMAGILGGSGGPVVNGVASGNGNPLSYIDPSEIESMEILKDADATAIYGSRAANGAILITTKKGKAGQMRVDLNIKNGWSHVLREIKLLNTTQYLSMRHEAFSNDGASPSSSDYDINGLWDTTRNSDWQKTLIGGTAQYLDYGLNITGGTANTQFLIGGSFHRETTVFPGDFSDQKGSAHVSINSSSENKKFKIQFTATYQRDYNKLPGQDLTTPAIQLPADAPPIYNHDGSLNWMPDAGGNSSWTNPLSSNYNTYSNKTQNLITNAVFAYQLIKGLELKSSFGYTNLQQDELNLFPLISTQPEYRPYSQRAALYGNSSLESWIIEPQLSYIINFGDSHLQALIGSTIQRNTSGGRQMEGAGYTSDAVLSDLYSATIIYPISTIANIYRYCAGFARLNYSLANKYLLDLVIRRDGSSRFGSANEYHGFGSVAAGWVFSQEKFIRENAAILSFGKLRSSYGTTGSDQIGDYQYLNQYYSNGLSYQGVVGLTPNSLPNPYLQWEETKKFQVALDLGFVHDNFLLNATYYRNKSSNQLLPFALPILTGFGSIQENFPATVENKGWEFSLNTKNISAGRFSWTSSFNITLPQNKLLSFPELPNSSYANYLVIGQPITIMKLFHYGGVNINTGIFQFVNAKGQTVSSPQDPSDRTIILNPAPKLYGGIQNNFQVGKFQVSFLFQFVKQEAKGYLFNGLPGKFNFGTSNEPITVLDRWRTTGDVANFQKFSQSNRNVRNAYSKASNSDWAYSGASYLRLKNLSLSYDFPNEMNKRVHFKSCKVYLLAQNLFTITKYNGLDPESLSVTSLPPLRNITIGLQVGL